MRITIMLQFFGKDAVGHKERIETGLGVDLEYAGIRVLEHLCGHLAVINETGLQPFCLHIIFVEHLATDAVADMHIYHSPWRQHCLLIRIAEIREDAGDVARALHRCKAVGSPNKVAIVTAYGPEHIGIVIRNELIEESL